MQKKTLSVFVDKSGRFQHPDAMSRFYIIGLVLHDQSVEIGERVSALDRDWRAMGLANFCFHAGPLVRGEKGYRFMMREQRTAIFARMMRFARQMPFAYHSLLVDKKFVSSVRQIVRELQGQLSAFLSSPTFASDEPVSSRSTMTADRHRSRTFSTTPSRRGWGVASRSRKLSGRSDTSSSSWQTSSAQSG